MPQKVQPKGTGMVTAFTWTLPASVRPRQVICSPSYHKWEREWRILTDTDGSTYLQYSQGVDPVHLTVR